MKLKRILFESPDNVDGAFNSRSSDARAFGFDKKGNVYIGADSSDWHERMYQMGRYPYPEYDVPRKRNQFKYPGRLWIYEQTISFWEYPKPNEFKKLIKKLSDELYKWEGKCEKDNEGILIAKTVDDLFDKIVDLVKKHHSYELPGIVKVFAEPEKDFFKWVCSQVR